MSCYFFRKQFFSCFSRATISFKSILFLNSMLKIYNEKICYTLIFSGWSTRLITKSKEIWEIFMTKICIYYLKQSTRKYFNIRNLNKMQILVDVCSSFLTVLVLFTHCLSWWTDFLCCKVWSWPPSERKKFLTSPSEEIYF